MIPSNGTGADLIIVGADVRTAHAARPQARALAIRRGRVLATGSEAEIRALAGAGTRVLDAGGAVVLPGLIDSHGHVKGLGLHLARVDLAGAASYEEVVARAASAKPVNGWIIGRGWDQNDWPDTRLPHHAALSAAVPEHPALLRRVDGHAAVANARAMQMAGITAGTADPAGGRIARDRSGEPTGLLIDNAIDLLLPVLPVETETAVREAILRAQSHLLERGLTMVGDAGIDETTVRAYRGLLTDGALKIRVHAMVEAPGEGFEKAMVRGPWSDPEARLGVRAVKLFADGALGSRGAALLAPYCDDPENSGLLLRSPEEMEAICRRAAARGFQPCVHAIGDRANRIVLDIFERLLAEHPAGRLRPRLEHAQILAPEDIARVGRLGVIASMQPVHCASDMPWAGSRLGAERLRGAYAWRSVIEGGARLAAGSDFPVESADPLPGLHAALTRRDRRPGSGRQWNPGECLTFDQALAAFTAEGAWAGFVEDRVGQLAPGFDADFVIVDGIVPGDPRSCLGARVRATFIAGALQAGRID